MIAGEICTALQHTSCLLLPHPQLLALPAELATTFPENSGYVAWVTAAFGPFWGFQVRIPGSLSYNALHSDCLNRRGNCVV